MIIDDNMIVVDDGGDGSCHLSGNMFGTVLVTFYLFPIIIITLQVAELMFREVEDLAQGHAARKCQNQYSNPDSRVCALFIPALLKLFRVFRTVFVWACEFNEESL